MTPELIWLAIFTINTLLMMMMCLIIGSTD